MSRIRTLRDIARVPDPTGGTRHAESDEDVTAWWDMLREQITRSTGRFVEWHEEGQKVVAYVNWGRWVGNCSCGAGMDVDPDMKRTACPECGAVHPLDLPTKAQRKAAEALLLERPKDANRNWDRHKGEDVKRLAAENRLLLPSKVPVLGGDR